MLPGPVGAGFGAHALQAHSGALDTGGCLAPQVAVEAETFSSAPGLRRRVLGELLAHLLDSFASAVPEQLAGAPLDYVFPVPCTASPTCLLLAPW